MPQAKIHWRVLVDIVTDAKFTQKSQKILTSYGSVEFSSRTVFHELARSYNLLLGSKSAAFFLSTTQKVFVEELSTFKNAT